MQRNINKYVEDYLNSDFENCMAKYRQKKVLEILDKYKPKKILEVGCGLDSISHYYQIYEKFTIVEPSAYFCSNVKNPSAIIVQDFLENYAEKCTNPDYDFIIVSALLHEVNDTKKFLKALKSLCSPDTICHINVPNSKSFHLIWGYESGLLKSIGTLTETSLKLQQNSTFNIDQLVSCLQNSGYSVIESGSYFIKPFNHKKMQILVEKGIISKNLLDGLYALEKYFPENGAEIFVNVKR